METKFTKGEWTVADTKIASDIHIWSKGTPRIAIIPLRDVSINEQKANAKLIAAAPDLLQSCLSAIELIGNFRLKKEVPTQVVWEQLDKAIKKAIE